MPPSSLAFARKGTVLYAAVPDALHVVDLAAASAEVRPLAGLVTFAEIAGEIWSASGTAA